MKTINLSSNDNDNVANWYQDQFGDIFETMEEAEICGLSKKIITDAFYVGTMDEWKKSIKERI